MTPRAGLEGTWYKLIVNRLPAGRIVLALFLALAPLIGATSTQASNNLLENPGFEEGFRHYNDINEVNVAKKWKPWWVERSSGDDPAINHRPEYKQADGNIYSNRVHKGTYAQQFFTFYSTHTAGLYQQVSGIQPGSRLQFSIWTMVWSSNEDDPKHSDSPAYMNLQVGIDPYGGADPWAGTIVWSPALNWYDSWGKQVVEATAQSSTVTVFCKSAPNYPVKHNDTYWDDASLIVLESAQPTATAVPPTATAGTEPSATPAADTATPAADATTPAPTTIPSETPTPAPSPTCAPPPEDWETYIVQRGEYLSMLAEDYGTTVDEIVANNCLDTTMIYTGQELLLPAAAQPEATEETPAAATATATPAETAVPTQEPTVEQPTPAPSATPIQIAAATLTSSPTPPPTAVVTPSPEQTVPAATAEPAASGGGKGVCPGSLLPGAALIGVALVANRNKKSRA